MSHPSINKLPAWIADSAWPKLNRKPMVFLADFDIPAGNDMSGRRKPHKVALFSGTGPGEHGPQIQFAIIEETGKSHQLAQGGHCVVYPTGKELAREERTRERNRLKARSRPK